MEYELLRDGFPPEYVKVRNPRSKAGETQGFT